MDQVYMNYREIRIAENKKRRQKIVKRQRFILGAGISILIVMIACIASTLVSEARSEAVRYKYYTSVTVHSGDTLESLADEYITEEYRDQASFIREVCGINNLEDEDSIMAGECIILPYYSEEFKE
ncbi:hypothetical protein SAMN04487928_10542 [Butyrivibrio proteoclasticus]|uniref:LysM domain-containing protein n=1 Tax=Butyrivibrio proteoclasticus TaxID=43305 RepID=A0A1I5RZJ1_9FIRM|nr:hypothetical protein [Butyrivibrio proteoclasticus]SFP63837.1 hypothetical protein SAMN04487928_10542 [Butyrivibrio proteoclasticus]